MEFNVHVDYNPGLAPNVVGAIERGVAVGAEKLAALGANEVQEHTPVASGTLVGAIQSSFEQDGGGVKATIFAGPPADVYSAPVETGAVPHMPPPQALLLWVMKRFQPESDKQALSIAWAVAKTIAKRGTQGAHMFQQAYEDILEQAGDVIEAAIAAELQAAGVSAA